MENSRSYVCSHDMHLPFLVKNTHDGTHTPKIATDFSASHPKFHLEQIEKIKHSLESNLFYSRSDIKQVRLITPKKCLFLHINHQMNAGWLVQMCIITVLMSGCR